MNKKDIFVVLILVILGILSRTAFHLGENIEFVTVISLAAGYFFKNKKLAFLTTFLILALSDTIIGNSVIFLFTWSAFLSGNLIGIVLSKIDFKKNKILKLALASEGAGILSTIIFYLWTNFGVVLTTNSYTKDLSGLMLSYYNGLPFLRPQLTYNLILVPLAFVCVSLLLSVKIFKNQHSNADFTK